MLDIVELDERHKTEAGYCQRMTTGDWKEILLKNEEVIIFNNKEVKLSVRDLGYGVVEIYKIDHTIST